MTGRRRRYSFGAKLKDRVNTNKQMCTRTCFANKCAATNSRVNEVGMNACTRASISSDSLQQHGRIFIQTLTCQSPYPTTCKCSCYVLLRPSILSRKCLEYIWPTHCTSVVNMLLLDVLRTGRYSCRHLYAVCVAVPWLNIYNPFETHCLQLRTNTELLKQRIRVALRHFVQH